MKKEKRKDRERRKACIEETKRRERKNRNSIRQKRRKADEVIYPVE